MDSAHTRSARQPPEPRAGRRLRGNLDRPKSLIARDCETVIEGWALVPGETVRQIVVHAGGERIGVAAYGGSRPDVALNFQEHPQSLASGFRFAWRDMPPDVPERLDISIEVVTGAARSFMAAAPMRIYSTLREASEALGTDFAANWQPWLEVARLYQARNDMAAALATSRGASERWPDVAKVAIRYAEIALRQNLAADARAALLRCLPTANATEAKLITARLARIEQDAQTFAPASARPREKQPGPDLTDDMRVVTAFEPLGFNCEFGFAQRCFHAEPISLLRFGNAPLHLLIKALADRFAGVGQPENTLVKPTWGTEYGVSDTRYNFLSHTGVHTTSGIDADLLFRKQCQRFRFLARKLLEDLESTERIFLYFRYDRLSDEEICRLAARLGAYRSTNRLLCVRLADSDHPPATIAWLGESTAVGYIAQFSNWQNVGQNVSPAAWLALCRAALTAFTARHARATDAAQAARCI